MLNKTPKIMNTTVTTEHRPRQQGDAFTCRAEVMYGFNFLLVSFQGLCHRGESRPNAEPLRSLLQPSGKVTAHNIFRSLHLPCSHCWTAISLEKQIRVRTLPGMLPITGVSSGEGCFLFGLFQIGKLYEVQLRQTDQDCRDCLFPVLAGS